MTEKKTIKNGESNDLMLPILLVLFVMPFVVRLAEYSCGYSVYAWHSDVDIIQDLYSYFRCYFFEITAIFALIVIVFRLGLYREKTKEWKIFVPLGIYGVFALLSTVFSVNPDASLSGNYHQFQGIFVILGYLVMSFYTYQILERERDYQTLWRGMIVLLLMVVIGGFQIAKMDLLNFPWMQKLVMTKEQFEVYGGEIDTIFTGSNVFLTLYNPNYAGVFVTMLSCVFGVMAYSEKENRKRIFYGILFLASLVLVWFTYSRATLIALAVALAVFLMLIKGRAGKVLKFLIPGLALLTVVLLCVDGMQGFHYLSRMIDKKEDHLLSEMITAKDGISIVYGEEQIRIAAEDGKPVVYGENGSRMDLEVSDQNEVVIPLERELYAMVSSLEEEKQLYLLIDDDTYIFEWDEEGYDYINEAGKKDQLEKIEKVDFGGYEYLGSGRLYIWSRTLPLLKDYLVVGSGPDTFTEVYPQNDYVGKSIYADTSARIMEKPHNDYLLQWVQNGLPACVGMICFYVILLKKGMTAFAGNDLQSMKTRLGMGCFLGCICYMIGSFFNDSTLYTTPMFWIFAGLSLAAGYQDDGQGLRIEKKG